jgi:hypothetical protein
MAGTNVEKVGVDPVSNGGQWLFRQEGLVLGPLPATKIVEMLYAGQIDGRTDVAPMGSLQFQPLANEELFRVHHAKAEAKRRVDAAAAAETASLARRRNRKALVVTMIAVVLAAGAAFVARYFAIHNPWKDSDELAFAGITMDPPTVTVARAHVNDEDLILYPGASPKSGAPASTGRAADKRSGAAAAAAAAGRTGRPVSTMSSGEDDPDGMQMAQFDKSAIDGVLAAKKKSLYPCFRQETERSPGFEGKIPLEFVIGNDGRVATLWIDHPQFKSGPLYDCLLRELQKWPFKAYEGERATVGLSFNIGGNKR